MPDVKRKNNNRRKVKQAKPKPRKPIRTKRSGAWRKVATIAGFLVVTAGIGAIGGYGARKLHKVMTTSHTFAIQQIEVLGNQRVGRDEILKYSGLKKGLNIFTVDIDTAAKSVESHPWIKGVTVKRYFPDKILINVVERTAAAIIRQNDLMLIDAEGEIFKALRPGDHIDMPVITLSSKLVGAEANLDERTISRVFQLLDLARSSSIVPQSAISEILAGEHGIELIGVDKPYFIKMGYEDIEESWSKLELVLADSQRSGAEVVEVDLRYKDGAALRIKAAPQTLVADRRPVKSEESD